MLLGLCWIVKEWNIETLRHLARKKHPGMIHVRISQVFYYFIKLFHVLVLDASLPQRCYNGTVEMCLLCHIDRGGVREGQSSLANENGSWGVRARYWSKPARSAQLGCWETRHAGNREAILAALASTWAGSPSNVAVLVNRLTGKHVVHNIKSSGLK